jgi:hypothetical protein
MDDAAIWFGLLLLAGVGYAATRFNPAVFYWRKRLTRLAVIAVLCFGIIYALGFFAAPLLPTVATSRTSGG